jgi:hypothetical protein
MYHAKSHIHCFSIHVVPKYTSGTNGTTNGPVLVHASTNHKVNQKYDEIWTKVISYSEQNALIRNV